MASKRVDFWTLILVLSLAAAFLFVVYPLISLVISGFQDQHTGQFSLVNFETLATRPFFYQALFRSFSVAISTTVLAVFLGVSMAYFSSMYRIKGRRVFNILIIISMLSPPFVGAMSWILLMGRNGYFVRFFYNWFGIQLPSIYGFGGIVLVMTLFTYPLVFLFAQGALKRVDASLIEAAESLGCSPVKKAMTLTIPLVAPSILAGALLVFIDAFSEFGTPMLLGEGYLVMPVLIFRGFLGELGGWRNFAAALSLIMVVISIVLFLTQKYLIRKKSFTMNLLRPIQPKDLKGFAAVLVHVYLYGVLAVSVLPQTFIIYTSFRATRGPIFVDGFSLDSYRRAFSIAGTAIRNTYVFGSIAIFIIVISALFIAYLTVRKKHFFTQLLDYITMLPFVIPGFVIGITLLMAFNRRPLLLIGTPMIMVLAFVVRRLPYTLRSSSAILHQISPSMEEAAISLGDPPMKSFFKITAVAMMPGVVSGAILSWITILNELNASVLLFNVHTQTMPVVIYNELHRGIGFGAASALTSILILTTLVSLVVFFKLTGKTEIGL